MEDKYLIIGLLLVLGLAVGAGYYFTANDSVECESKYDEAVEGEIKPEDIPDECRPLPEEVEQQLLVQALSESS